MPSPEKNESIAPWSRTVILGPDADNQIKKNGEDARILKEAGFWAWTPEAQAFLAQELKILAESDKKDKK